MLIPFYYKKVKVTSPFGLRTLNGAKSNHKGYDLVGIDSSEVTAVVGGTVGASTIITDKSNKTWEWGNYIRIDGDDGRKYYYCHLASRSVSKGAKVVAGQKIGIMGNTGYSFGAHLHFEVRENGVSICPEIVTDIPNKVGTYIDTPLTKIDYIKKIAEKAGFSNPAPAIESMDKLEHPFSTDLWRKIWEAMK